MKGKSTGFFYIYIYIYTVLDKKCVNSVFLCVPLATDLQKLHVTLLSLASVNGIIALVTMQDYFI